MEYDHKKIEEKWQKKWYSEKVFEPKQDKKKKKFFFTVPYPYVNGPHHIGHGRTYTIGDIIARYKIMQGFNVLWPIGYHLTGTPVLAVSNAIKNKELKKTELYRSYIKEYEKDPEKVEKILKSFEEPENVARYFANTMHYGFMKMGYAIDFSREFTTMDPDYQKMIEWQFGKYDEAGYIVKERYPILYCINDQNAVGEDDIQDGDQIKAEVQDFVLLKFRIGNEFIVAATLRPETVFGQTNIWLDPDVTYKKVKVGNETWIMSAEAVEKISYQKMNTKVVGEIRGSELVGKQVIAPLGKQIPVLPSKVCYPDMGTGIVFSVPGHAPQDYIALKDLQNDAKLCKQLEVDQKIVANIKPIYMIKVDGQPDNLVDEICKKHNAETQKDLEKLEEAKKDIYKLEHHQGIMKDNCGKYAGMTVADAKEKIKEELKQRNEMDIFYEVSALKTPVKCRCGGNVIVAVLDDQWFLHYSDPKWKSAATKCLNKVEIYPEVYRKQFEDIFEWLDKRPCARRRGLGTKFPKDPKWIIESLSDSTIYMAFYIVKKHINEMKLKPEQLTKEFWDYVLLGKRKCATVPEKDLEKIRDDFEYWYPNDHRHTAIGHLSNHLPFFIYAHAAIFPEKHWPKKITISEMLIREGAKMSKSKGNVIPLVEVPVKFGSDLFRLYIAYAADMSSVMDFKEQEVESARKKLHSFYAIFSNQKKYKTGELQRIDKWMLSKLNSNIQKATQSAEALNLREYVQAAFFSMLNDVTYYLGRTNEPNAKVMKEVTEKTIKLMTPIIPHACEELWEISGNKNLVSFEQWPKADMKIIDKKIEAMEEVVGKLETDITNVIKLANIKPKKITLIIAPDWKRKIHSKTIEIKDPRQLIKEIMKDETVRKNGKEGVKYAEYLVRHANEIKEVPSQNEEIKVLEEALPVLSKQFNTKIIIEKAEESKNEKKSSAVPLKPAIFVE